MESELTLGLLEEMGCDIGQGFLFSRPLPYERLEAWLAGCRPTPRRPRRGEVRRLRAVRELELSRRRGYLVRVDPMPAVYSYPVRDLAQGIARPLSSVGRASPW